MARMGRKSNDLEVFFGGEGVPERKIPLGRPTHKWKDNIKVDR